MRTIFNPIYRLLTTVQVFADSREVLETSWKRNYEPFGYELKKPIVELHSGTFRMFVCKNLKK